MSIMDNIKGKRTMPPQRREPQVDESLQPPRRVDMQALAEQIRSETPVPDYTPDEFAPPEHRADRMQNITVQALQKFADLPTSEIDRIEAAADHEHARLKAEAQRLRDSYQHGVERLKADFLRYVAGAKLSTETFEGLRERCSALDKTDIEGAMGVQMQPVEAVKQPQETAREQRTRESREARQQREHAEHVEPKPDSGHVD
jgi:hypothetical protein